MQLWTWQEAIYDYLTNNNLFSVLFYSEDLI